MPGLGAEYCYHRCKPLLCHAQHPSQHETTCDTVNHSGSADTVIQEHTVFTQVTAEWVEKYVNINQHTKNLCETSESLREN